MNFVDKDGITKVYIPVHPCIPSSAKIMSFVNYKCSAADT